MTGTEIGRMLKAACGDAGLDSEQAGSVLLAFTLRWGQALMDEIDVSMYEAEMNGINGGDENGGGLPG